MQEAVQLAHQKGYKCICKVDRLYMESELEQLTQYLKHLSEIKIDDILISDLGVKQLVEENQLPFKCIYAPETLLTNQYDVQVIHDDGFAGCVISKDIVLKDMLDIANSQPEYCYLRGYGPILISYSKRRFISLYLQEEQEHINDYYLTESNRPEQRLPIVEKQMGSWLYGPTLICFDSLTDIKKSKLAGLIFDGNLYDDDFNLQVVEQFFACEEGKINASEALENIKRLNQTIEYTSLSEIKKTGLDKA